MTSSPKEITSGMAVQLEAQPEETYNKTTSKGHSPFVQGRKVSKMRM